MNKHEKGEYGYLAAYKRGKLIGFIIFALMIEFIVITLMLFFGSTKRVGVVFAILLVLPMAKFFIAYILCVKFKPLTDEEYKQMSDIENEHGILLYDIAISQYEGFRFYPAMFIKNGKICAYVNDKGFKDDKKSYEKWIKTCISRSKYEYTIYVFGDLKEYIKKANSISEPNDRNRLIDKHIKEIITEASI